MIYDGKPWLRSYDDDVKAEIESPEISLKEYFEQTFERYAGRPAFRYRGMSMTFGELLEESGRFAKGLQEKGVGRSDVIAICLPNIPQYTDDILGFCDYNSFFSSKEAVAEWRNSHPNIKRVTRDPRTICQLGKLITRGCQRLHYYFQFQFPILKILWNLKKIVFTKPVPALGGLHLPDPFMMMTPHFFKEWKRQGCRNYARFSLL